MVNTQRAERIAICPPPTARGLSRVAAAEYIGVSPSLFDQMVLDGRMPEPKRINSRTVWDLRAIDRAFDQLPGGSDNPEQEWETAV